MPAPRGWAVAWRYDLYGLIVRLTSAAGRREELIAAMGGEDSATIAGCLSFIVAKDAADEDVLWITEVWESRESHEASLEAPQVKEGLAGADTLIVRSEKVATTTPVERASGPLHGSGKQVLEV